MSTSRGTDCERREAIGTSEREGVTYIDSQKKLRTPQVESRHILKVQEAGVYYYPQTSVEHFCGIFSEL